MATTTHSAYGTLTTVLNSEFNNLVNSTSASTGITALSSAQDNSSGLHIYADFVCILNTQASNRVAPSAIELYIAYAVDGSTYDVAHATYKNPVGIFKFVPGVTTADQDSIANIEIPPGFWKAYARNITGQQLASSGTFIKYRTHSVLTA